jgi:uncharacterized protein
MKCPVCGGSLRAVERMGVSLDHCPTCQGLWLDQGELTELVRREAAKALEDGLSVLQQRRHRREYDALDLSAPPALMAGWFDTQEAGK